MPDISDCAMSKPRFAVFPSGVEAVVMSAGELESEIAGKPGRLIRERYRKAADKGKVRGAGARGGSTHACNVCVAYVCA